MRSCLSTCSSLLSGAYSDLTVVCAGNTHRVHKVVVCGRSEFFARAIQFGGQVRASDAVSRGCSTNATQESHTGTIDLSEDEPEVVALLVQYLYEGEYDPTLAPAAMPTVTPALSTPVKRSKKEPKKQKYSFCFPHTCIAQNCSCTDNRLCPHHRCGYDCACTCKEFICAICAAPPVEGCSSQLLTHTKMYEVADKYEVIGLKDLAKEKFRTSCRHFWDTSDFPIAAHHAFSTTPESDNGLRGPVIQTIATHMELSQVPEIRALLMEFNGLALSILDVKSEELGWGAPGAVKNV